MPYIHVPQHRCARMSVETPDSIEGLYTQGFLNCAVILLLARDRRRSSLMHADARVRWPQIAAEIDWLGQDCEKIIFRKSVEDSVESIMSREQRCLFEERLLPDQAIGVAVKRDHQVIIYYGDRAGIFYSEDRGMRYSGLPELLRHEQEAVMLELYVFNNFCASLAPEMPKEGDFQFLTYDSRQWLPPSRHDVRFTEHSKRCYEYLKDLSKQSSEMEKKNAAARLLLSNLVSPISFFRLNMPAGMEFFLRQINYHILDLNDLRRAGEIPE